MPGGPEAPVRYSGPDSVRLVTTSRGAASSWVMKERQGPPYRRLRAWKAAYELTGVVYRITMGWPAHERYGLTSQARRAAVSIAVNIAEGSARRGVREFAHFLSIAYGLHTELQCLMDIARGLDLIEDSPWQELQSRMDITGVLVWKLLLHQRTADGDGREHPGLRVEEVP